MLLQGRCQSVVSPHAGAGHSSRGLQKPHHAQPLHERLLSNSSAGPSGSSYCAQKGRGRGINVAAQLFGPPVFNPRKLTTTFLPGATPAGPLDPRRYTLTHNDLTGQLALSIGAVYNTVQVSGWYTRLIRDEVLAEWRFNDAGAPSLHVQCHVSGEERWLAPPALRNFIFQREMPLVLDTVIHADRQLFSRMPHLAAADVFVHLSSHVQELNMTLRWGALSQRASWPLSAASPLQTWWQYLRMPAESRAVALGGTAVMPPAADLLTPASQGTGGGALLGDDASALISSTAEEPLESGLATTNGQLLECAPAQGLAALEAAALSAESVLGQPGEVLLPAVAGSLPEQLDGSGVEGVNGVEELESVVVLPATAGTFPGADAAGADGPSGSPVLPGTRRALASEPEGSSTAVVSSRGQRQHRDSSIAAAALGCIGAMPESSFLECSRADGWSQFKPITVRDIVSEWVRSGHEVVTVRR